MRSVRVVGRHHQWWRPTPLRAAVAGGLIIAAVLAVTAVVTAVANRGGPGRQPKPAAATMLRDALLDLIQPGQPFPTVIEPTRAVQVAPLANAMIAAGALGVAGPPDVTDQQVDDALGTALAAQLSAADHTSVGPLHDAWLGVRALTSDGTVGAGPGPVAAALAAYLHGLPVTTTDPSAISRAAMLARIAAMTAPFQPWSTVNAAAVAALAPSAAHDCAALNPVGTDFTGLGLIAEVAQATGRHCTRADGLVAALPAQPTPGDLVEISQLVRAHLLHPPSPDGSTTIAARAMDAIAAEFGHSNLVCPTEEIRTAVDLGARQAPTSVADCLVRELRWEGHLAETYSGHSAMGTFLALTALDALPADDTEKATLQTLTAGIGWTDAAIAPMDRLILELSFDPHRIDVAAIDRAAATAQARSALGVLVLNASAARIGHCGATTTATDSWLAQADGAGDNSLWSVFAANAARTCASPQQVARLSGVRSHLVTAVYAEPAESDTSGALLLAWLQRAMSCLPSTASPTSPASAPAAAAFEVPDTLDAMLRNGWGSSVSLYASTMLIAPTASACHALGWLGA